MPRRNSKINKREQGLNKLGLCGRRHTNKTGLTQIKSGALLRDNKRIAKSLGIPFLAG